jgi:hypothetical protein
VIARNRRIPVLTAIGAVLVAAGSSAIVSAIGSHGSIFRLRLGWGIALFLAGIVTFVILGRDPSRARIRIRAAEDLEWQIAKTNEEERSAIQELLDGLAGRGVLNSSLRPDGERRIRNEHDERREAARRTWRRSLEDAGIEAPRDPPA